MSVVSKRGWGTGIALLFGSFATFILVLVGFSSFQQFNLVENDYYDKELKYQETIDKINRVRQNPDGLTLSHDQRFKTLTLSFGANEKVAVFDGDITFFRPSNPALDFIIPVKPDGRGSTGTLRIEDH